MEDFIDENPSTALLIKQGNWCIFSALRGLDSCSVGHTNQANKSVLPEHI